MKIKNRDFGSFCSAASLHNAFFQEHIEKRQGSRGKMTGPVAVGVGHALLVKIRDIQEPDMTQLAAPGQLRNKGQAEIQLDILAQIQRVIAFDDDIGIEACLLAALHGDALHGAALIHGDKGLVPQLPQGQGLAAQGVFLGGGDAKGR